MLTQSRQCMASARQFVVDRDPQRYCLGAKPVSLLFELKVAVGTQYKNEMSLAAMVGICAQCRSDQVVERIRLSMAHEGRHIEMHH